MIGLKMSFLFVLCSSSALVFAIRSEVNYDIAPVMSQPDTLKAILRYDDATQIHFDDIETLLPSLERLVNFYAKFSNEVDINTVFGFFLLRVNLEKALANNPIIPSKIIARLKAVSEKSHGINEYFQMMAAQPPFQTPPNKNKMKKVSLYSDEEVWLSEMKGPDKNLKEPIKLTPKDIMSRFSSFQDYIKKIGKIMRMVPPNAVTDNCLKKIADNHLYHGMSTHPKCKLPQECVSGVTRGNNTGYGMVNRLSILVLARFGRRCTVVSQDEDQKITNMLCSSAYEEAWFISLNNFVPLMIFLDILTYCSLNGNVGVFRKDWYIYILALQTSHGCFSDELSADIQSVLPDMTQLSKWTLDRGLTYHQPGTNCYGPTSSAAAAYISAVIKFILEYKV